MKKKKLLIILGGILVVILLIGAFFIFKDLKQEAALEKEMQAVYDITEEKDFDIKKLRKKLNTNVSKGDYLVVEKAIKKYLSDVFDTYEKTMQTLNDQQLVNLLSIENYKKDGPNFIDSKKYIQTTKTNLTEYKDQFIKYLTEETIISYIEGKKLDSYYIDFYKKLSVDLDEDMEEVKTELEQSINEIIQLLDKANEVLNFLEKNKANWKIENNQLYLQTDALVEEYNRLLQKATE